MSKTNWVMNELARLQRAGKSLLVAMAAVGLLVTMSCGQSGQTGETGTEKAKPESAAISEEQKPESPGKAIAVPADFEKYVNPRYDFCVQYPGSFQPRGESANADGQTFVAKNEDIEMTVFGMDAVGQSLQEAYQEEQEYMEADELLQAELKEGYFILSWRKGTREFYQKRFGQGDVFQTIFFEYPANSGFETLRDQILATFPACPGSA